MRTKEQQRRYDKTYRTKHRTQRRNLARRYRAANPALFIIANKKAQCKAVGREFDLTVEDILPLPTHCPVFGIELDYGRKEHVMDNSPSLDRLNSTKGYVRGNVAIISHRANRIKNEGTIEEHELVIAYMKRQLNGV